MLVMLETLFEKVKVVARFELRTTGGLFNQCFKARTKMTVQTVQDLLFSDDYAHL